MFKGYPRFLCKLWDTSVEEGGAIVLSCKVDGKPFPDVYWTLNGQPLDDKTNHIITAYEDGVATVTILRAYTDDEGEYCCRVFNSCGASTSKSFLRILGKDARPSAPSGITFSDVTRNDAKMSWKSPGYLGHFGGSPLEGYIIERAEVGSSVWRRHGNGSVKLTQMPLVGLKEGGVYFFRVKSFTKWGISLPSLPAGPLALRDPGTPRLPEELADPNTVLPPETDDISVEEEDFTDIPGIPTDVSAEVMSETCVVSWKAPDSEDIEIDGYLIEYSQDNNDEWITINNEPLQTTDPYPVTELSQGHEYRFRVCAINMAGPSDPSEPSTFVMFGEFGATKEIAEVETCLSQIIQDVVNEDNENLENGNKDATETEECIEETDQCILKSKCVGKEIKDKIVKTMQRGIPSAPTEVKKLKVTREHIEIGWLPPFCGENLGYFVEMSKVDTNVWKICNSTPIRFTRCSVTGVMENDLYIFRVRAVNENGTSEFSKPSYPISACDDIKPPNWWGGMRKAFRVADEKGLPCVTKNSIKVCWEEPTVDGGSPVLGYFLEYRPTGGKFKPVNNKPLTQRHFTVGELTEGIEYEFRISACNIAGCGGFKILPVSIVAKDPARPSDPTDVLFTDVAEECVTLKWKKPQELGDGEFIGYIVERCKEGSDIWIPCNKIPEQVEKETYHVDGLVTGQTYFFRVTAVNSFGQGISSLPSVYVTAGENLDDVLDRQGEIALKRRQAEEAKLEEQRIKEEEDRKEAFIKRLVDLDTEHSKTARFECLVKNPATDVEWFFGNNKEIKLSPDKKYEIITAGKNRTLMITNCQLEDINIVHCVALYNGCTTSAYNIVDGMVPVEFIERPVDCAVNTGETGKFECKLSRDDAKVKWFKYDDEITTDDDRYIITSEGPIRSLQIKDATWEDIGEYTVTGYGGSVKIYLIVDDVMPATFTDFVEDADYKYDAGEAVFNTVVLPSDLYVDGELPECVWYHNGERIEPEDDKYEIIRDGNNHTLKILNLNHEDSGSISCICGGSITECDISVDKPPPPPPTPTPMREMAIRPEDIAINFKQGLRPEALTGSMRLYCAVTSIPDHIEIVWYYDDKLLTIDDKKYRAINDPETGFVSLIIENLCIEDGYGRYTCELISPLKMFDTKVHYQFQNGDFDVILEQATMMHEEAEKERLAKLEERQRKRKALKNKREGKSGGSARETPLPKAETPLPVEVTPEPVIKSEEILYEVSESGQVVLYIEGSDLSGKDVTWLKNSVRISNERYISDVIPEKASLEIKNPESEDAGTYTCLVRGSKMAMEMSADITGKVFKQLLKTSAEKRIAHNLIPGSSDVTDAELAEDEIIEETQEDTLEKIEEEVEPSLDVCTVEEVPEVKSLVTITVEDAKETVDNPVEK